MRLQLLKARALRFIANIGSCSVQLLPLRHADRSLLGLKQLKSKVEGHLYTSIAMKSVYLKVKKVDRLANGPSHGYRDECVLAFKVSRSKAVASGNQPSSLHK